MYRMYVYIAPPGSMSHAVLLHNAKATHRFRRFTPEDYVRSSRKWAEVGVGWGSGADPSK